MILALTGLAFAGGVHAGIPVTGVAGVTDPAFESPALGWTAAVPGGFARVFVGRAEVDAERWYAQTLTTLTLSPPAADGVGDACAGDGDFLFLWRDGNVAALVRADGDARAIAARLHAAIEDGAPWPAAPALAQVGGQWIVDAPGALAVQAEGGRLAPFKADRWVAPPTRVVAWDRYGRPAVLDPR